jgi:hypothetical protein
LRRQGMRGIAAAVRLDADHASERYVLGTFDNGRRRGVCIGKGRELNWIVPPRSSRLYTALAPMARWLEH